VVDLAEREAVGYLRKPAHVAVGQDMGGVEQ
jgi:hypothetical protein